MHGLTNDGIFSSEQFQTKSTCNAESDRFFSSKSACM